MLHKELNTMFPEPDYYHANTQPKTAPETAKPKHILTPPPLSKTYVHGTVEAEEKPGISNCMAIGCALKEQGHWKGD